MASYLQVSPSETTKLTYHSELGTTGLYPQVKVYNGSTLVTTLNLAEVGNGYYYVDYAPDGTYKYLFCQIIPYTDSGHTIKAEADLETSIDLYVEYPYRMPMGRVGGVEIDYKKLAKEIWHYKIGDENAEQVLSKKSEFNPESDIVKTDLKIEKPVLNIRAIQDTISEKISQLEKTIASIKTQKINFPKLDLKPILDEIKKNNNKEDLIKINSMVGKLETSITNLPSVEIPHETFNQINNRVKDIYAQLDKMDNVSIISDLDDKVSFLNQQISQLKSQNQSGEILQKLEILVDLKKLIIESQDLLEALNQVEGERATKIVKAIEKILTLISLNQLKDVRKELQYISELES